MSVSAGSVERSTASPAKANDTGACFEIITVAYLSRQPLLQLLRALPEHLPLIIVDNSRQADDLSDLVEIRQNTRYLDSGGNIGFGAACNLGVAAATLPYVVLLNPDTVPDPAVLQTLIDVLAGNESCAACGASLIDHRGHPVRGGGGWEPSIRRSLVHAVGLDYVFPYAGIWHRGSPRDLIEVDWLAGTCVALRREVFLRLGGFDSRYFLYQEDMDLGRRLRSAHFRLLLCGAARIVHAGGESSPSALKIPLWRQRAAAMSQYLNDHHPTPAATVIQWILAAGFLARATYYLLAGRTQKRTEMMVYVRTLVTSSLRRP